MGDAACAINIGRREIARRRAFGWICLGVAMAGGVLLVALGEPRWYRLALLPAFAVAQIGFLQAREKT